MAGGPSIRWELDPLFSAAEVVQDSADRMESFYRLLMHESNLAREENKDNRVLNALHYHKRDLVTAIETTKWQLEDFDRAVQFASLSDESGLRKNAISKHRQFVHAIREQISLMENYLEEISTGDSNRSIQWTNSNEPDSDGLASFLSGRDTTDHHLQASSVNSIFDSVSTADEIVEIESNLQMNDIRHLDYPSNSLKGEKPLEISGNHIKCLSLESPSFRGEGIHETGYMISDDGSTYRTDIGRSNMKCLLSQNRLLIYVSGLLSNFCLSSKYRFSCNSMKRRKDGEIGDDLVIDVGRSNNIALAEQGKQAWMSLSSSFLTCNGANCRGLVNAMQVGKWLEDLRRTSYRSQGLIQYLLHMRPAFIVIIAIIFLGLLLVSLR